MTRGRLIHPAPRLSVSLAMLLCIGAVSATSATTFLAQATPATTRPLLQPREEAALSELLACLRDAARQIAQPAATAPQRPRVAPTPGFAAATPTLDPDTLRVERGDYRAHLLNLPPPVALG